MSDLEEVGGDCIEEKENISYVNNWNGSEKVNILPTTTSRKNVNTPGTKWMLF